MAGIVASPQFTVTVNISEINAQISAKSLPEFTLASSPYFRYSVESPRGSSQLLSCDGALRGNERMVPLARQSQTHPAATALR
jgi:hypothetical protein